MRLIHSHANAKSPGATKDLRGVAVAGGAEMIDSITPDGKNVARDGDDMSMYDETGHLKILMPEGFAGDEMKPCRHPHPRSPARPGRRP